jgi:hypothetical protein
VAGDGVEVIACPVAAKGQVAGLLHGAVSLLDGADEVVDGTTIAMLWEYK